MSLDIDLQLVIDHVKSAKIGANNINKDFLSQSSEDDFVRRGKNSTSQRCLVIWISFIPSKILADIYKGTYFVCAVSAVDDILWYCCSMCCIIALCMNGAYTCCMQQVSCGYIIVVGNMGIECDVHNNYVYICVYIQSLLAFVV